MFGVTAPAVETARARLADLGYEVLVFHATGAGGRPLESLAEARLLAGVLDITATGGCVAAISVSGPAYRLLPANLHELGRLCAST